MKSFWLIFSFYIIILSVLPCTDKEECNEPNQTTISTNTEHQNHDHETEHCSPFCTCSCCAASVFFPAFSKVYATKVVFQTKQYPLYHIAFKTEVSSNIWQPARLATSRTNSHSGIVESTNSR